MVVLEELGRGLMPEPLLSTVLLGANALLLGGSEAQKKDAPAGGRGRRAPARRRVPGGAQPLRPEPRRDQGRRRPATAGRSRGEKIQVLDGHVADRLIVCARTAGAVSDAKGITLFLVAADTPGVTIERQSRIDGAERRARAARRRAGRRRRRRRRRSTAAARCSRRVIDRATIGLCAEMLGAMQAAFEMTIEYLKTRVQFGVPIGSFQALKHRAAKMYIEIELARSAVMGAHRALDEARATTTTIAQLASLAKARCSDAFVLVGNEGVQMHGGIGMTDEHDIGFFLKRARVAEMTFGDAALHRERTARLDGY